MAQPAPNGPRPEVREAVRGYVEGYNRYLRDVGVANLPDPACRGAEWVQADRGDRRLPALLPARAARLERRRHRRHRRRAAADAAPSPPAAARAASRARTTSTEARRAPAARRDRLERLRHRPRADRQRQGDAARQPALPVGRHGALLPGAPHDPRQDGRQRRQPARRPGRAHRPHARAGVEPHGLDRVPLHAVRAHARPRLAHDVPRRRRAAADDADRGHRRGARRRAARSRSASARCGTPSTARSSPRCSACRSSRGRRRRRSRWATPTPRTSATSTTSSRRTMAQTVREYDQVLRRNQGIPWVNSIAADSTGEAYYADISVVPHVTDEHAERCNTAVGHGDVHGAAAADARRLARGLQVGQRPERDPAGDVRAGGAPAVHVPQRLHDERQRLVLAGQPQAAARGLPAHRRQRAHARGRCARASACSWSTASSSRCASSRTRSSTTASTRASCGCPRCSSSATATRRSPRRATRCASGTCATTSTRRARCSSAASRSG